MGYTIKETSVIYNNILCMYNCFNLNCAPYVHVNCCIFTLKTQLLSGTCTCEA